MAQRPAIHCWDITAQKKPEQTAISINNLLREIAKKWAFQLEAGEEKKREHWQIRISLIKPKRLEALRQLLIGTTIEGCHLSPTANVNSKSFNYVMKLDTRVDGPWTEATQPKVMPKELKEVKLYPWQEQIVESCKSYDGDRTVNVLIDLEGGHGKGLLRKYLHYHGFASCAPIAEAKDVCAWIVKFPHTAYIFDVPRQIGDKPQSRTSLYKAIEMAKDGRGVELRYTPQDVQLPQSPVIWVLCNEFPNTSLLSADRWCMWAIDPKTNNLIKNVTKRACEGIALYVSKQRIKRKAEEISPDVLAWEEQSFQQHSTGEDEQAQLKERPPKAARGAKRPPQPPPQAGGESPTGSGVIYSLSLLESKT